MTVSREVAEHAAGSSAKAMAAVQIDAGALCILTKANSNPLPTCTASCSLPYEGVSLDSFQPETG